MAAAAVPALLHLLQRREPPTVEFPAARYLVEAERRHSRRLRLRHLLLLALRTLAIVAIVLAAARPVAPLPIGGAHAPSALVLVVDNSLSSGVVVEGTRTLDAVVAEARRVARAAGAGDQLWLVTADGMPRATDRLTVLAALDALAPVPLRLDLTEAARAGAAVLAGQPLPGRVVILSDLQATAFSSGPPSGADVVVRTPPPPVPNLGIASARPEPATFSPGGRVVVAMGGSGTRAVEVSLQVGGRVAARELASAGAPVALAVEALTPGWHAATIVLDPDELRSDDVHHLALRGAPPAAVSAGAGAGAFVGAALEVLADGGRVRSGRGVVIDDRPGAGTTVLLPPADPAAVGAVNRALAARGVPLRFGALELGEWALTGALDGVAGATVTRRHRLDGDLAVLARAGGEPWLVRAGETVALASRLEPGWTSLPTAAGFVPFLDAVVNRVAAAQVWHLSATPGAAVLLPPGVVALAGPDGRRPVVGDRRLEAPAAPGLAFLLDARGDTVGALAVNPDPRESDLRPASRDAVRAAFGPGTMMVPEGAVASRAFAAARRAELTTALLAAAIVLAAAELAVATLGGARRTVG